jgi:hypothetical protein
MFSNSHNLITFCEILLYDPYIATLVGVRVKNLYRLSFFIGTNPNKHEI